MAVPVLNRNAFSSLSSLLQSKLLLYLFALKKKVIYFSHCLTLIIPSRLSLSVVSRFKSEKCLRSPATRFWRASIRFWNCPRPKRGSSSKPSNFRSTSRTTIPKRRRDSQVSLVDKGQWATFFFRLNHLSCYNNMWPMPFYDSCLQVPWSSVTFRVPSSPFASSEISNIAMRLPVSDTPACVEDDPVIRWKNCPFILRTT